MMDRIEEILRDAWRDATKGWGLLPCDPAKVNEVVAKPEDPTVLQVGDKIWIRGEFGQGIAMGQTIYRIEMLEDMVGNSCEVDMPQVAWAQMKRRRYVVHYLVPGDQSQVPSVAPISKWAYAYQCSPLRSDGRGPSYEQD